MEDRVITYPADALSRVADMLMDRDYGLEFDEAQDIALDIVLDVTESVDKLRRIEYTEALKKELEITNER